MSMGGGGSSKPPVDIMSIKPDPTKGVLPPSDGTVQGIQRRAAGQDPNSFGSLIGEDLQIVRKPEGSLIG